MTISFLIPRPVRERAYQAAATVLRETGSIDQAFRAGVDELHRGMLPRIHPIG